MAKRRIHVAIVAVVLGALTATGAAFGGVSERERPDRPGVDHRAFCERLEQRIQHLREAIGKLQAVADRLKEKIASGELTPEQEARARKALAHIEAKVDRLQEKLEELLQVYRTRCED